MYFIVGANVKMLSPAMCQENISLYAEGIIFKLVYFDLC